MGVAGVSHTRDALLEVIQELNMRRPHNMYQGMVLA